MVSNIIMSRVKIYFWFSSTTGWLDATNASNENPDNIHTEGILKTFGFSLNVVT